MTAYHGTAKPKRAARRAIHLFYPNRVPRRPKPTGHPCPRSESYGAVVTSVATLDGSDAAVLVGNPMASGLPIE